MIRAIIFSWVAAVELDEEKAESDWSFWLAVATVVTVIVDADAAAATAAALTAVTAMLDELIDEQLIAALLCLTCE